MKKYTILKNEVFGSFEITFSEKPDEGTRTILKNNGYRWHSVRRIWYGYKDIGELLNNESFETSENKEKQVLNVEKPEQKAKSTPIKFYYNGIKINGENSLIKCSYSIYDDCSVCIYDSSYGGELPRDLFEVQNDTDIQTDYFDKDSAVVTPDHPLYKFAFYNAKKSAYMFAKKALAKWEKRYHGLESEKERYERNITEFESLEDVGQPTNADLLKVDEMNDKAESAKKAKEEAKERQIEEKLSFKKTFGKRIIDEAQRVFPLAPDEKNYVIIGFSEHPAFYDFKDGLKLSIPAADYILFILDRRQNTDRTTDRGVGWYDKTDFTIYKDGEAVYSGRYDIGDGEGGLIAHVESLAQWYATHSAFGGEKEKPTEEDKSRLEFAEWLRRYDEAEEADESKSLDPDDINYISYFS